MFGGEDVSASDIDEFLLHIWTYLRPQLRAGRHVHRSSQKVFQIGLSSEISSPVEQNIEAHQDVHIAVAHGLITGKGAVEPQLNRTEALCERRLVCTEQAQYFGKANVSLPRPTRAPCWRNSEPGPRTESAAGVESPGSLERGATVPRRMSGGRSRPANSLGADSAPAPSPIVRTPGAPDVFTNGAARRTRSLLSQVFESGFLRGGTRRRRAGRARASRAGRGAGHAPRVRGAASPDHVNECS